MAFSLQGAIYKDKTKMQEGSAKRAAYILVRRFLKGKRNNKGSGAMAQVRWKCGNAFYHNATPAPMPKVVTI